MRKGIFITFEGLDGSGKTTQLRHVAAELESRGYAVTATRQPGGTAIGDRIRGLLLDSRNDSRNDDSGAGIAPLTEMALMFADRAQALAEVILPALAAGRVVLCDRYTDSSEAYQGAGRGLGAARVRRMHEVVCEGLEPDLTILLLPPLQASLQRARRRNLRHIAVAGMDENRFEGEDDAFYTRVYAQYEEIARREPGRVLPIRDNASIESIAERVLSAVLHRIEAIAPRPSAQRV